MIVSDVQRGPGTETLQEERAIIHIDMDAFYASIEQQDHPELRGQGTINNQLPSEPDLFI